MIPIDYDEGLWTNEEGKYMHERKRRWQGIKWETTGVKNKGTLGYWSPSPALLCGRRDSFRIQNDW